jgi:hypothetical protein
MPKDEHPQVRYQPAESNPTLKQLDALVGEWKMEIHVPTDPPTVVGDLWTTFEWMEGGHFLVWQWGPARPDFPGGLFPAAHSLIGYEESAERYLMHYFDSRGVARLLEMSLEGEVWKIWRSSPGFSQRFKGTVRDNVMTGFWEKSSDGTSWELDFEMVFTKET